MEKILIQDKIMHAIRHTFTQTPLGFLHLVALYKIAMLRMQSILVKQTKSKDHSPSMTLFKVALRNDLSPSKC